MESDSENEIEDEGKDMEPKMPRINDIEKAIVEESLNQMIERIDQVSLPVSSIKLTLALISQRLTVNHLSDVISRGDPISVGR